MGVVVFVLLFSIVSFGLIAYSGKQERNSSQYDVRFIKGTARGIMGRFSSSYLLEEKRQNLNKKNSKF